MVLHMHMSGEDRGATATPVPQFMEVPTPQPVSSWPLLSIRIF